MEKHIVEETSNFVSAEERARLVQFCTWFTKDKDAAEDLAQETLFEAWCHESQLRDQSRRSQWLLGIARNVCLRWLRKHRHMAAHHIETPDAAWQQDIPLLSLEDTLADDLDIEIELERKELIELLDRALALLPAEARTILIKHYIEESPLAEVAAQFGTNAHALAMRLQRGKLALRRVLTQEMRHELAPYNLASASHQWETTPLWCHYCGLHRLQGKREPNEGGLYLKCPLCSPGTEENLISSNLLPILKGIKGYKPLYTRLRTWCDLYYRTGLRTGSVACDLCGQAAPVSIGLIEDLPLWMYKGRMRWQPNSRVVNTCCLTCQTSCTTSLEGLVLSLPASAQFQQDFPRIRTLPQQQTEVNGRPAIISRLESVTTSAALTVVSTYDTYEVLHIYREV